MQLLLEASRSALRLAYRLGVFFGGDLRGRLLKALRLEPAKVRLRPILAPGETLVVAQQHSSEALTKLFVDEFAVAARAAQIADRFVFRRGRPDRAELAGAIEPSQGQRVAPIGLDAIAGFARGQRRRDQVAIVFGVTNLPANAVATGAGFVAVVQPLTRRGECGNQATNGFRPVVDLAVEMRLAPPRRQRPRYCFCERPSRRICRNCCTCSSLC